MKGKTPKSSNFLKLQAAVLNTVISANAVLFKCAGTSKYIAIWFQIAKQGVKLNILKLSNCCYKK
jgi:hypothetical protein